MEKPATPSTCPIACAASIFADKWSLLIVRNMLFFGHSRYRELLEQTGIATNILASRLKQLIDDGLIEKFRDPADRKSFIYLLTDQGLDLLPVLESVARWGLRHRQGAAIDPLIQKQLAGGIDHFYEQTRLALEQRRRSLA